MSKNKSTGVFQLPNGNWAFRFAIVIGDKKKDTTRTKDEFGQLLKTEKNAIKAREQAIRKECEERYKKAEKPRKTVKEVYQEYCQLGRNGKAYATIKKQDSFLITIVSESKDKCNIKTA